MSHLAAGRGSEDPEPVRYQVIEIPLAKQLVIKQPFTALVIKQLECAAGGGSVAVGSANFGPMALKGWWPPEPVRPAPHRRRA
jgi:hypothetical protein